MGVVDAEIERCLVTQFENRRGSAVVSQVAQRAVLASRKQGLFFPVEGVENARGRSFSADLIDGTEGQANVVTERRHPAQLDSARFAFSADDAFERRGPVGEWQIVAVDFPQARKIGKELSGFQCEAVGQRGSLDGRFLDSQRDVAERVGFRPRVQFAFGIKDDIGTGELVDVTLDHQFDVADRKIRVVRAIRVRADGVDRS